MVCVRERVHTVVMVDSEDLQTLHRADQRVVRTVDSLDSAAWSGASVLPGWTRAHVVAHLALNAEGLARALGGVQDGETVPIYDSNEARDEAIVELAGQDPSEIRDRFFGATARLRHLFGSLTQDQWAQEVNRLPEGPVWPVGELLTSRLREVEIHHTDLDAGYAATDWPQAFAVDLLDQTVANHVASGTSQPFTAVATDSDRTWDVGATTPVVSGPAAALAWWLVGRGEGRGLTSDHGPLPALGPWGRPVSRP
jgi:maleylpyruvate isomerase